MLQKPLSTNATALLSALCARYDDVVWLDTARGDGLSILAFGACDTRTFSDRKSHSAFREFFEKFCFAPKISSQSRFAGGWIGYLAYESFALNPLIPFAPQKNPDYPLSVWRYYDTFLECRNGHWHFVSWSEAAEKKWSDFSQLLSAPPPTKPQLTLAPLAGKTSFETYQADIAQILAALHRGDYLELNYTVEFCADWPSQTLCPLYLALREHCPAPMMAFYNWPEIRILSASPENFFEIEPGGQISTQPIKGTIARGKTPDADLILQKILQNGEKEKSELLMVTDLLRNDLGRICKIGSVKTPKLFALKTFSHYHHLVSKITGELLPHKSFYDVFCALFPGGSITGAPKIQVMRDIDRLEKRARGVYTGALGFLSDSGHAGFNIPIRTLTHDGKILKTAVGGGIVAESTAAGEYEECLVKLSGMQKALAVFD